MKERGEIGFVDNSITTTKIIPPGNYTLSSIGKKMQELFEREYVTVKFNDAKGSIVLENPYNKKIIFDRDLTFLLGLNGNMKEISRTQLKKETAINRLVSFNNYFTGTAISWTKMKIYSMESHPRYLLVLTSVENHSKEWNIHQKTLR